MIARRVVVAHTDLGTRAEATLGAAVDALAGQGTEVVPIVVDGDSRKLPRVEKRTLREFVATPEILVEGWRSARLIASLTRPGDVVLVSELAAAGGGLLALGEATRPPAERRRVVIAGGDGQALHYLAMAGTIDGVADDDEYAIDWELVAYRYADQVLVTSPMASQLLDGLGLPSLVIGAPEDAMGGGEGGPVLLADPPSRIGQTTTILQALNGLGPELGDVYVLDGERTDHIFAGSTWDALSDLRETFGDRLIRGVPDGPATVIVGDPFRLPDAGLGRLAAGGRVLAPRGSALSVRWPDAEVWSDADDLAARLKSPGASPPPPREALPPLTDPQWRPERARAVSVAVPVFGDVRFLDECVASILGQSQPPYEVVLVDDGSASESVAAELARLADQDPRIRVVTQPNRGVCSARNNALGVMTGDAFLFVDADDVLEPEFIAATADGLRADPEAWAMATWTRFFGEYEGVEAKPPFDRRIGLRENPIVGTAALLAVEVRDAGIEFSPDLAFLFCEDWELWSKIVAGGGRVGLVPRVLANHRVHPSSGGHKRTPLAHSLGKARATAPLLR